MSTHVPTNQIKSRGGFYTWVAVATALIVLAGFARAYYLKELFGTRSLPVLLHVHGLVMTLWFVLFLVQVRLVAAHRTDPKGVDRTEFRPVTADGMVTPVVGTGFVDTNLKWSINGYIFGNMPMMTMKQGDHVRWYVATLGGFNNAHTPHWHGNTVLVGGQRTDVVSVLSAQMITADMVPDAPGISIIATSAITSWPAWSRGIKSNRKAAAAGFSTLALMRRRFDRWSVFHGQITILRSLVSRERM